MQAHKLATIATVNAAGKPEAAVIGFGQTEKLELVFGTDNSSRKYTNILSNPEIAFVIGWENNQTMQYEGTVRELSNDEISLVQENYWSKNLHAEKHHKNPGERYFIVSPKWIRHTDLSVDPWIVTEMRF